jgi:hypothetical protein
MRTRRASPPGENPRREPPPALPPPPAPGPAPAEPPPAPERDPEAAAKDAWIAARAALVDGRYAEALDGYALLAQRHAGTTLYRENRKRIAAGLEAARVGSKGPVALLSAPAEVRKGRLEVEYPNFDDASVVDRDFDQEQPFSSDRPVEIKPEKGFVRMSGASGLFLRVVFLPDVRLEADVTAEVGRDFGAMATEESDRFRAVMIDVANTVFKLKKGDAARVQPGHVLWFFGEGVWAAADPGEHGFIKIAERPSSRIESGDRVLLELVRHGDRLEGGFQGKTDGVSLSGRVKGDDGKGMGSARVGLFTNTGALVVHSIKVSGVVDMEWFAKRLRDMVAADPGP